jgi:cytochrome c biogenesis protein CcdA/thiol-disulfide isomerase/thioredoxin
MFKKIFIIILLSLNLFLPVKANDEVCEEDQNKVLIEVFGRENCQHCQDEKNFLHQFSQENNQIKFVYYDLKYPENKDLFYQITKKENLAKTTPLTFVANTFIQGYKTDNTTGHRIKILARKALLMDTYSIKEVLEKNIQLNKEEISGASCAEDVEICEEENNDNQLIFKLPFINKLVNLKNYSLPVISITLGFIDGFNPCALWVLIIFITILIQIGDKKKMLSLISIFLISEALIYLLILIFWLKTWDFIGLDDIITKLIGLLSVGAGTFFIWEFAKNKNTCKVLGAKQRRKTQNKILSLINSPLSIGTFLGIIFLAFSVNIIEFACSVGIPQTFTKILDINNLNLINTYFYLGLYLLFYMIDDLIVFLISYFTFEKTGLINKYSKQSQFIGGLLMLILGTIFLVKPSLLVF